MIGAKKRFNLGARKEASMKVLYRQSTWESSIPSEIGKIDKPTFKETPCGRKILDPA